MPQDVPSSDFTSTPREATPQWGDRNWYGEQNADGVDLSLIRENLRLSVDERVERGERARDAVRELQRYTRVDGKRPGPDRENPATPQR